MKQIEPVEPYLIHMEWFPWLSGKIRKDGAIFILFERHLKLLSGIHLRCGILLFF